jgi:hypothetical protein
MSNAQCIASVSIWAGWVALGILATWFVVKDIRNALRRHSRPWERSGRVGSVRK